MSSTNNSWLENPGLNPAGGRRRHPLTCKIYIFYEIKSLSLLSATLCAICYKQEILPGCTSRLTRCCASFQSVCWHEFAAGLFPPLELPMGREDRLAHRLQPTWKLARRQHPAVCLLFTGNCQYYSGFLLSIICPNHITLRLGVRFC